MISKIRAFTLIELVVTMALMAILFVIAAPGFLQFQKAARLKHSYQILETTFGEAFSSSRSHPEYFIISGENDKFKLQECEDIACSIELKSKEFVLNSGVKFREEFLVKFSPPFGDIEFSGDNVNVDYLDIEVYNDESIIFRIHKKSGLMTRFIDLGGTNPEENEK
jgi:prepilin-type N-terminal cleavage/methylation domain-containing protein